MKTVTISCEPLDIKYECATFGTGRAYQVNAILNNFAEPLDALQSLVFVYEETLDTLIGEFEELLAEEARTQKTLDESDAVSEDIRRTYDTLKHLRLALQISNEE